MMKNYKNFQIMQKQKNNYMKKKFNFQKVKKNALKMI